MFRDCNVHDSLREMHGERNYLVFYYYNSEDPIFFRFLVHRFWLDFFVQGSRIQAMMCIQLIISLIVDSSITTRWWSSFVLPEWLFVVVSLKLGFWQTNPPYSSLHMLEFRCGGCRVTLEEIGSAPSFFSFLLQELFINCWRLVIACFHHFTVQFFNSTWVSESALECLMFWFSCFPQTAPMFGKVRGMASDMEE